MDKKFLFGFISDTFKLGKRLVNIETLTKVMFFLNIQGKFVFIKAFTEWCFHIISYVLIRLLSPFLEMRSTPF